MYDTLTTDHPIDLTRWQVANCYMGRVGLINSGGASSGERDLAEAVRTAVINKRAGGTGLISGRKAFQRPMAEGVELLNAIQDVYLDKSHHRRVLECRELTRRPERGRSAAERERRKLVFVWRRLNSPAPAGRSAS